MVYRLPQAQSLWVQNHPSLLKLQICLIGKNLPGWKPGGSASDHPIQQDLPGFLPVWCHSLNRIENRPDLAYRSLNRISSSFPPDLYRIPVFTQIHRAFSLESATIKQDCPYRFIFFSIACLNHDLFSGFYLPCTLYSSFFWQRKIRKAGFKKRRRAAVFLFASFKMRAGQILHFEKEVKPAFETFIFSACPVRFSFIWRTEPASVYGRLRPFFRQPLPVDFFLDFFV